MGGGGRELYTPGELGRESRAVPVAVLAGFASRPRSGFSADCGSELFCVLTFEFCVPPYPYYHPRLGCSVCFVMWTFAMLNAVDSVGGD